MSPKLINLINIVTSEVNSVCSEKDFAAVYVSKPIPVIMHCMESQCKNCALYRTFAQKALLHKVVSNG